MLCAPVNFSCSWNDTITVTNNKTKIKEQKACTTKKGFTPDFVKCNAFKLEFYETCENRNLILPLVDYYTIGGDCNGEKYNTLNDTLNFRKGRDNLTFYE